MDTPIVYGALGRLDASRYFAEHPQALLPFLSKHVGVDTNRLRIVKAIRETREADHVARAAAEPEEPVKGKGKGKK